MPCHLCGGKKKNSSKYCGYKCKTLYRLRKRAIKQLLDVEEKTFGDGYDSVVKRAWITRQLEDISRGDHDERMYKLFLERNDKAWKESLQ